MKILTANRLVDGEAVWLAADYSWAETIDAADVATTKDAEDRLEAVGTAPSQANIVVDVNLVDINLVDGEIVPVRLRERIRAAGPTNRLDLGKQARLNTANAA